VAHVGLQVGHPRQSPEPLGPVALYYRKKPSVQPRQIVLQGKQFVHGGLHAGHYIHIP